MDYFRQNKEMIINILNNFVDIKLDTGLSVKTLGCFTPVFFSATPKGNHNPEFLLPIPWTLFLLLYIYY